MKIKKTLSCCLAVVCNFACLNFAACSNEEITDSTSNYIEKVSGDFIVHFYDNYCEIYGTSEQGNEKQYLVIPAYIEGVEVRSLGAYNPFHDFTMYHSIYYPAVIDSQNLEKMYFEKAIDSFPTISGYYCPNLEKVFYPAIETFEGGFFWGIYYPRKVYEQLIPGTFERRYPANISYYYNYDRADGEVYYWFDDCDYGARIDFIPPEPTRDGYTFGGWYKESECINKWDFNADALPELKTEMQENSLGEMEEATVYQETILYAKWVKA